MAHRGRPGWAVLLLVLACDAGAQSVASRACRQADGSLRWQDGSAPCPAISAPGAAANPYATMAPMLGATAFQFGQALGRLLASPSEPDAGAAAAQQAAQRRAEQEALARAAAQEEARKEQMKNRLLAMMMMPSGGGAGYQGLSDAQRPQFTFDEDAFTPLVTSLPPGSASAQLTQAAYYSEQAAAAKTDEDVAALADAAFSGALGVPSDLPVPSSLRAVKVPEEEVPHVQAVREEYRRSLEASTGAYAEVVEARAQEESSRQALERARAELASARRSFMKSQESRRKQQNRVAVAHKEKAAHDAKAKADEAERRVNEAQARFAAAKAANQAAARQVFDLVAFIQGLARRPNGAFQRGLNEGSGCMSPNVTTFCSAHPDLQDCANGYMVGYRQGVRAMEEKLRAAWNEGRNQIGNPRAAAIGFNHPNAVGPCRVQWLESFNNGAFGAPFSLVGK